MQKTFKIALSGGDYSGKDTALDMIKSRYSGLSFSDGLKKIAHDIFPWIEKDYCSFDKETLTVYTNPDTDIPWTPRTVWEALDILPQIDPDVFIRPLQELENKLMQEAPVDCRLCIKDIRRPRELEYCKRNGYHIIFIDTNDARWVEKLKNDHRPIIQFREEIKCQADTVFLNSKTNPNWESDFASFLSGQLFRLGDEVVAKELHNNLVEGG